MIVWVKSSESVELSKFIECYWFIEKTENSNAHDYPKLNPDPYSHLILSPAGQEYHYDLNPGVAKSFGSHWLFPHQTTIELDHSQAFSHLGIKFHPGALYALGLFEDSSAVLNTVQEAPFNIKDFITSARDNAQQCCQQLDDFLLPWLEKAKDDSHSVLTFKALPLLVGNPIAKLSEKLSCSQRTLERSFNKTTGLTLKQCQSMNNLDALLEYVHRRDADEIDWVDIAYRFGFSDQPHLIRSLKKQIGLTPKVYSKDRGLAIDVYGGISSIDPL